MPCHVHSLRRSLGLTALVALGACADSSVGDDAEPSGNVVLAQPRKEPRRGRWVELRAVADRGERSASDLEGIGYSGAYEEGGDFSGSIVRDADGMEPGLTLVCSGHDTSVLLLDEQGTVHHHWHLDFDEVFPDPLPFEVQAFHTEFVRRAWPYPNGDLLAIFEYIGITRVDPQGQPIWARADQSHHDFKILPDGTIVTLDIERWNRLWMRRNYDAPRFMKGVINSHVVFLSDEGELQKKISIFDAFYKSRFAPVLNTLNATIADIFHANSVDILDERTAKAFPLFAAGDILVSLRNQNALAVIDGETELVKWVSRGLFVGQHQGSFLPNGRFLLLDNGGGNLESPFQSTRSRILEVELASQTIGWQYPRPGEDVDFYTAMLGYVERLPGGNTLITESMQGHLIEVNPAGDVVWEYYSPYRAGDRDELITTLMGARRIPHSLLPFLDQ